MAKMRGKIVTFHEYWQNIGRLIMGKEQTL